MAGNHAWTRVGRLVFRGLVCGAALVAVACGDEAGEHFVEGVIDGVAYRQDGYTLGRYLNNLGTQVYASDSETHKNENINKWYIVAGGKEAAEYPGSKLIIKYYFDPQGELAHFQGITGTTCTLRITTYGDVGGVIEGTFSGELKSIRDQKVHPLTSGRFRILRDPDA